MDYPISLDTALQIVGSMKVAAINKLSTAQNIAEKKSAEQEIDMYLQEEKILYGEESLTKLSVIDKVMNYYSPTIKKRNGFI